MDISYFQKINNTYQSASKQETDLYLLNNHVNKHFADTIGYHTVKKNDCDFELIISKISSDATKKRIKSRPGAIYELGDYIEWNNRMWLVIERDSDDQAYIPGKMQQCNHKLRWQNSSGEIVERWAIIANASKYSVGENGNSTIMLPEDSFLSFIRVDDETIKLRRGQKFFCDYNKENPTVYELTRPESITYSDETIDGKHHGYSNWIIQEKSYTATDEELKHGVVGWRDKEKPTTENPNQSSILLNITGKDSIKVGGYYTTYKGIVTDSDGNPTDDIGTFTINSGFDEDILNPNISASNQMKVKISDTHTELVGETFDLVFFVGEKTISKTVSILDY